MIQHPLYTGVEYRLGTLTTIMIEASVENSTISQLYSSMGGAWSKSRFSCHTSKFILLLAGILPSLYCF